MHALPPARAAAALRVDASHALVVRAQVTYGVPGVGDVPVTTAELRLGDGSARVVRIVGGPRRAGGGVVRLAGYVVPRAGTVVRVDLAEEPRAPSVPSPASHAWTTNTPPGPWPSSALPVPLIRR